MGYKKIAENYKEQVNSKSLLEDALALYDKAIKIDNKPYLSLGKNKIQEKINVSDINLDKSKKIEYRIIKRKKAIQANLAARN